VGVESDLLLLAASWVHQVVRVQVASLSIMMSYADSTSKCYIHWDILHSLRVESSLEFGAHEPVSVSRVDEADEVDPKHGHIERDRDYDEAENSGNEMLGKQALFQSVIFSPREANNLQE